MKIFTTDKTELMTISSIEEKGADLLIKGKIFGAMPMSAVITPEQARLALRLLTPPDNPSPPLSIAIRRQEMFRRSSLRTPSQTQRSHFQHSRCSASIVITVRRILLNCLNARWTRPSQLGTFR